MQFGVPLRRILEPPSAERIASHSAASAEAESTGTSIVANKSGCVYSDAAACRRSSSCSSVSTSAATTFTRRTSKRLSTIERKSLSTASQIRDVADVGSGNAIDPVAGLGTRRPYLSIGHRAVVLLPRHVRQSPSNQRKHPCQAVSDRGLPCRSRPSIPLCRLSRPSLPNPMTAYPPFHAQSAGLRRITAGPVSTCPELKLCPAGLYTLMSAMVHGSQPHAWSMSSSAFTPNILYSRSSL